jgi:hypothetical protein
MTITIRGEKEELLDAQRRVQFNGDFTAEARRTRLAWDCQNERGEGPAFLPARENSRSLVRLKPSS